MSNGSNTMSKTSVLIAGAGPAGSSLAIRLAKAGLEVTLVEREIFPRHKLCGEFISPECISHFEELGVAPLMLGSGGDRISETFFYSAVGNSFKIPSAWFGGESGGALGLSRARMDLVLIEKARSLGVETLVNSSVRELIVEGNQIRWAIVSNGENKKNEIRADIFIDATGRAGVLSKMASKAVGTSTASDKKWIGFKAHFENVNMKPGRCEIYLFEGGYGGLNYVEDGVANHCFLVKSDVVRKQKGNGESMFRNGVLSNPRAKRVMLDSEQKFDWIAVTIDQFGLKKLVPARNLFSVGDSAAFIDPFTGSGMLMALESAQILSQSITESSGNISKIKQKYVTNYHKHFSRRLRVSSVMRQVSLSKRFGNVVINGLRASSAARLLLAKATRSGSLSKRI